MFRHMKKMKTAIGTYSMGKQLISKKSYKIMCVYTVHDFAVDLKLSLK